MIKYLWIIVLSLLLLFAHPLWAKEEGEATTTFLLLPQSARILGVGGAAATYPLGASSIFYNPASLGISKGVQATFMYSSYIVDTSFGNVALSYPTPFATIGAGFIYLRHGKIKWYDKEANPLGRYTAQDMCAVFSLAKELLKGLCLGASIKWIESKIEEESADTFCFDVGARFDTPRLSLGVVLQNQGDGLKFIEEKSPLPSLIRCGVGAYLTKHFMIITDVVFPKYGERSIFAGGELLLKNISLRAGYQDASELKKGICLGAGLFSKRWVLDIGFSPTEELGNTYYISFSFRPR